MSSILAISTSIPEFLTDKEDFINFYGKALKPVDENAFGHKLRFLTRKTKIEKRYSCLPDFRGSGTELFGNGNYEPPVTERMKLYKKNVIPLAVKAIDRLFLDTKLSSADITHFITVSCTGLTAPGIEFQLADHYGLQHAEKFGLYFLGCYAAMKALKQANYIAQANPKACILIVCVELCSLHFNPSEVDEDIIANLLFADGAAATVICGDRSEHIRNKTVLRVDQVGSVSIPGTSELMTWDVGASNFNMYLNKHIASKIGESILKVTEDFLNDKMAEIDFWAVHPGGVKIVDTVRDRLGLKEDQVQDSLDVLRNFGNMSSPTILFILSSIFEKIKAADGSKPESIFSCAFGPGISIEMIRFSAVNNQASNKAHNSLYQHAIKA